LETTFPDLWDDYIMGKHRDRMTQKANKSTTLKTNKSTTLKTNNHKINLPKLSDLPADHLAVSYTQGRQIPTKYMSELYYAEHFKKWSNTMVPGTFENTNYDEPRLIIPFFDVNNEIFAFQGRALKESKIKYLTVKIHDKQKIFGLDKVDLTKPVYVVEGPIDSMFLDNAVGTADASLESIAKTVKNAVYVWDNEPRSPIIVKKMEQAIDSGHKVVIWKKSNAFNDINDAILKHGFNIVKINELVKSRTFQGMMALVELNNWRKV
jgi:hypothetical protein